jgi:hypothetical protein
MGLKTIEIHILNRKEGIRIWVLAGTMPELGYVKAAWMLGKTF